ncbi:MAG: serine/threonine protein kinase [Lachnospiraceae bacterium]
MTLQEEYVLSCYEVLCRMEEGKEVYLVRNRQDGHFYIKKSLRHYSKSIYEKLKQLQITGLPKVYFFAEDNGQLILIEEFVHGRSLKEIFEERGAFTEEEVCNIGWNLCRILKPLHSCQPPLIHRDIKPSNVMYSNDGVLRLIDFDAAKEYTAGKTQDTCFMGTPDFAAPEQYGFGQSDARTDIYAIGVLMNYLLTGQSPTNCLAQGRLQSIIQTCCNLDASKRFHSVDALAAALYPQKASGKESTSRLYTPNPKYPIGFRSGNPGHILLALIGYVFLCVASIGATFRDSNHQILTGIPLWINRVGVFLIGIGTIVFCGNYRDMWSKFPGMRNGKIKQILFGTCYLLAYAFLILVLVIALGG